MLKDLLHHVVDSLLGGPRGARLVFTGLLASQGGPYPSGTDDQFRSRCVRCLAYTKRWAEQFEGILLSSCATESSAELCKSRYVYQLTLFREDLDSSFREVVASISAAD